MKTQKPKQLTRDQLQERIKDLLKLNAETVSSRDASESRLIVAYKTVNILEKKLCSRFHWIETVVAIAVISTFAFTIGLNISRKPSKREKLNVNVPTKPAMVWTNKALTNTYTAEEYYNANKICFDKGRQYERLFQPTPPVVTNKTYHPIITRKGAEMLRR